MVVCGRSRSQHKSQRHSPYRILNRIVEATPEYGSHDCLTRMSTVVVVRVASAILNVPFFFCLAQCSNVRPEPSL